MQRRAFLRQAGLWSAGAPLIGAISVPFDKFQATLPFPRTYEDPILASEDEAYWKEIRAAFSIHPSIVNLNNGGVSPQPLAVQDAEDKYMRESNLVPSFIMWRQLDQGREPLRNRLAQAAGCQQEEIAVNRNTTEALNTVIMGLRLKAGDEVIHTHQDYPNMINAWKLRELRDGIKIRRIDLQLPEENEDVIVSAFEREMNANTKLVHITHMINWNGQILPVRRIADLAESRGIEVLVDGAHTFGHLDFRIPDLNCDYFGTSLHKWMCAPFGSGMLYVRKEKIAKLYPLFPGDKPESDDIRKFEHLGTRSIPIEQAIGDAISFHEAIGIARKEARLRHLKDYWTGQLAGIDKVRIHTPGAAHASCAIAAFSIDGQESLETSKQLFSEYELHTVAINWPGFNCVRVAPNIYTLKPELDRLVAAVREMAV